MFGVGDIGVQAAILMYVNIYIRVCVPLVRTALTFLTYSDVTCATPYNINVILHQGTHNWPIPTKQKPFWLLLLNFPKKRTRWGLLLLHSKKCKIATKKKIHLRVSTGKTRKSPGRAKSSIPRRVRGRNPREIVALILQGKGLESQRAKSSSHFN